MLILFLCRLVRLHKKRQKDGIIRVMEPGRAAIPPPTGEAADGRCAGDVWSGAQSTRDALVDRLGKGGDAIDSIHTFPDTLLRCRPGSEWFMTGG